MKFSNWTLGLIFFLSDLEIFSTQRRKCLKNKSYVFCVFIGSIFMVHTSLYANEARDINNLSAEFLYYKFLNEDPPYKEIIENKKSYILADQFDRPKLFKEEKKRLEVIYSSIKAGDYYVMRSRSSLSDYDFDTESYYLDAFQEGRYYRFSKSGKKTSFIKGDDKISLFFENSLHFQKLKMSPDEAKKFWSKNKKSRNVNLIITFQVVGVGDPMGVHATDNSLRGRMVELKLTTYKGVPLYSLSDPPVAVSFYDRKQKDERSASEFIVEGFKVGMSKNDVLTKGKVRFAKSRRIYESSDGKQVKFLPTDYLTCSTLYVGSGDQCFEGNFDDNNNLWQVSYQRYGQKEHCGEIRKVLVKKYGSPVWSDPKHAVWGEEIKAMEKDTPPLHVLNATCETQRALGSGAFTVLTLNVIDKKKYEEKTAPPKAKKITERPKSKKYHETGRDIDFIAYSDGIILDLKTGLEWIVGPDHTSTLQDSEKWVKKLKTAGGSWRLPTIKEAQGILHRKSNSNSPEPIKSELFRGNKNLGVAILWTSDQNSVSNTSCLQLVGGYGGCWPDDYYPKYRRAYAVRNTR